MHVEIVYLSDDNNLDYNCSQILAFSENLACSESGFTIEETAFFF
ncbi:MAG: hypothetical protein sL5_03010 [Candidatus Mesenet longicola]|uniref:Uncharacterized protein n=1 Tax=Candidatus Mesenet longicola TaxID=1892558 RepID=A0A8J3HPI7_9RICK|nr:MAG: hypothetical protein sGL2_03520 [Candidatus Mesenet longicola]GHM59308.1 MAG: hypothetical protein sL5_03010 [Candidatus Mesenet longicola]